LAADLNAITLQTTGFKMRIPLLGRNILSLADEHVISV
jgi:hypothetical protein